MPLSLLSSQKILSTFSYAFVVAAPICCPNIFLEFPAVTPILDSLPKSPVSVNTELPSKYTFLVYSVVSFVAVFVNLSLLSVICISPDKYKSPALDLYIPPLSAIVFAFKFTIFSIILALSCIYTLAAAVSFI